MIVSKNGKQISLDITPKEQELMRAILISEHRDGYPATSPVWVDCLQDHTKLDKRSIGGIMTSLNKKGLAGTDGETCWLTEQGVNCYFSFSPLSAKEEEILNRSLTGES